MEYPEYITHIQSIVSEYMPNESELTRPLADELGARLLALDVINPNAGKTGYHQTVVVYREHRTWVPITVFFQTASTGQIQYVRIHAPKFVAEYGEETF